MQIEISGQHMDVTPALRKYVIHKFERIERHFDHVSKTHVVMQVEKMRHLIEGTIQAAGHSLHAKAEAEDMYSAIDSLIDKLDRQVVKMKEKSTNYRNGSGIKLQSAQ
ncbi:MAG: ribosomal subunit interface protein [Acidiferrobacteraceae bacterium]|jgi:putative sigma-54 modulation protein|nr:ribosomal subunit interface protein [Acidiferrobacteraceae bacterium]MDP6123186.1 ribosome-associated translation inhibitor RaiA [Arenicellales bacterium]MBT59624.1 ribosomal subunit interface protein [Acidiferrobacteraceae bacterium]MDP6434989.1 ribosome-associated translation inhibitor RaiA [Arenicellales bacterium]MDP6672559.1 ribosome-associated translation inhibitor RaiA [Arenicellales bacterium]|tara:strand:- start:83 stop:406 length:324 start_codon:yes stop_codon:yes gene_type:complete